VVRNTRNKILDAAEHVALRDGAGHLTLDAVAVEAGLSKGGVLYNYPSKDALVRGMVDRLIEQTDAEIERLAAADPEPRGRALRCYLGVTFPEHGTASARITQVAAVLLTAVLTNQELLDPVRRHLDELMKRLLADGLEAPVVHMVRLAADGLWMADMLRLPGPDREARQAVIQELYAATRR
jgi:AcrR family transcriptional regulator